MTVLVARTRRPKAQVRTTITRDEKRSVITYGELVFGARKSGRVTENLAKVQRLSELYPIIDVTRAVVDCFGETKARLSSSGTPIDDFDLLIGCTALTLGFAVVSNKTRHFHKIPGLKVVNWA